MANKKRTKRSPSEQSGHAARRRSIDAPYDATEPEHIRELERPAQRAPENEDEFVTDAEMEAREIESP